MSLTISNYFADVSVTIKGNFIVKGAIVYAKNSLELLIMTLILLDLALLLVILEFMMGVLLLKTTLFLNVSVSLMLVPKKFLL